MRIVIVILLSIVSLAWSQQEAYIEIGSFNLEWFPCKDDGEMMKQYGINLRYPPKGNATDMDALFALLKDLDIELLAVVEIVDPEILQKEAQARLGEQFRVIYAPDNGSQKVGFLYDSTALQLIGQPEIYSDLKLDPDSWNRPAFRAYFKYKPTGYDFHAIVVHLKAAPSGLKMRRQQWSLLAGILRDIPGKYGDDDVILMGDFNNVSKEGTGEFESIMDSMGYYWATSELAGKYSTSFWKPDYKEERIEGSLIDQIFISPGSLQEYRAKSIKVGGMCAEGKSEYRGGEMPAHYELISDHCPVYGSFRADIDND